MSTQVENIIDDTDKVIENAPEDEQHNEEQVSEIHNNEADEQVQEPELDDLKAFLDFFSAHDTEKTGSIKAEHLYEVATMMGKDSQNVDHILKHHNKTKDDLITLDEYQEIIADLDRPNTSAIVSEPQSQRSQRVVITPDPKVIEFIRLLFAFQGKCEAEGKYGEAKLAQQKIEEIKLKEILRQENNIKSFQEEELAQVENAQKEQFIEFNRVWDNYMADYEATALESLDKLKEKHIREVEDLHERLKRELAFHFKSSKQLLELRQKEAALVKMKKYGEAEKIKAQADALEEWEKSNKEKEVSEVIDKKTIGLRKQQQRGLTVLLKRIQKDRNQQLKNREQDSQKLILKNRNLRNELLTKHSSEAKNAIEVIRSSLAVINVTRGIDTANKSTMSPDSLLRKSVV